MRLACSTPSASNQSSACAFSSPMRAATSAMRASLERRHGGAHEGLAQVRHDQPLRAQDARRERHEAAADAEALRHVGRVQRPGAAERQQREGARIVPALDRDRADRPHHVGDHDAEHAVRGALDREAEPLGERRDRLAREALVERHVAAEQPARRKPPEHEVRVGDGRLLATAAVAGRARLRARALRADLHQPVAVEPGDRAAAGADRIDVERGEPRRIALDPFVEGRAGACSCGSARRPRWCRPCRAR